MKTKTLRKNKVNVVTLGCSKNLYDSEVMMAQLKANNFDVKHESDEEDYKTVIVNTCGFIEDSKKESIDTILDFVNAKNDGIIDKVYVTGCLSERYKDDLRQEIPEVDEYFGTKDLGKLLRVMKADYRKELVGERILTTPSHYAYFKIAEGCDRPCSFCAIPLMRGKHVSKPIEELLESAKGLAEKGVKELILIAQDLTYYGLDLYKKRNLAELINKLSKIDGIEWIRLHYAYPSGFPLDIIDEMASNPKVCNYLDMPLQHISDSVLKSMRRGTTSVKTRKLLEEIRLRVPNIAMRTTLISGYPGESEEDFQEMLEWIKETKFERLGIFPYSHEENTHAHTLEDDVSLETKRERAEAIMEAQRDISLANNKKLIGQNFKIIIDREEGEYYVGRTEYDSPEVDNEVLVKKEDADFKIGEFYKVNVFDVQEYDLFAKPNA